MTAEAGALAHRGRSRVLLADYEAFVETLDRVPQAKANRRRAARCFLGRWPDIEEWMGRPTPARLADLDRTDAWPLLTWCFLTGVVVPDLDLLGARARGAHLVAWTAEHRREVERALVVSAELGWAPSWAHQVCESQLALVCLTAGVGLDGLNGEVLDSFTDQLETAPTITANHRMVLRHRLAGLRQVCFQLGLLDAPPPHPNARDRTVADHVAAIPQPEIRRVAARYLETVLSTLRPKTVADWADSLELFGIWLHEHHPELRRLDQLQRPVLEEFLVWNKGRPSRGRRGAGQPVSTVRQHQAVTTLRTFFEDLAEWGWAERPSGTLIHRSDLPRLPDHVPRALTPDVERDLMAAVARERDVAARCAIRILRGTGVRLGELLDLELDCLMDFAGHGTWLRVPLGKLHSERTVPLDSETLDAFDDWTAHRGRQRALPHPRTGRLADFLFVIGGRRMGGGRIRRALADAVRGAGLRDPSGRPLHVTPHQLRHTYGTALINGGMSLQALMALLGHVTPEMTLRYAHLASDTVRSAYDAAMAKARTRQSPLLVASPRGTFVPDRVAWLEAEMLKTRVAHGYCSRHPAAGACPYANICEQCDNFAPGPEFSGALRDQLADVLTIRDDADRRGWDSEVARHDKVIASIEGHLRRLNAAGSAEVGS
jgi:integrase